MTPIPVPAPPEWITGLLLLTSLEAQIERAQAAGYATEDDVIQLLDYTEAIAPHRPTDARILSRVGEEIARQNSMPSLIPKAHYLRARTHALVGEPQEALALIHEAHQGYTRLDLTTDALRTNIGLINIHVSIGDYAQAISLGQKTIEQIDSQLVAQREGQQEELIWILATLYVTVGPALAESGRYDDALAAYDRAESLFNLHDSDTDLTLVYNNRGVALRYLGRIDEALRAYEAAAHHLPPSGYFFGLLQTNIGDAHALLGDYQASLHAYGLAQNAFVEEALETDRIICMGHVAAVYLALNAYSDAATLYQEVYEHLAETDYRYYCGKALWGMAVAANGLGQVDQAHERLEQALAVFTELDNQPLQISIRLDQATLLARSNNRDAARNAVDECLSSLTDANIEVWPVQHIMAHLLMADLQLPNLSAVETSLAQLQNLLEDRPLPHLRYRLYQRLGHLRRLQQRTDEAESYLNAAIGIIEELRATVSSEALRISFQDDKMESYEELLQLYLEQLEYEQLAEAPDSPAPSDSEAKSQDANPLDATAAIEQIFALMERSKSRALVERLSGTVDAHLGSDDDSASEAPQLRQLRMRLNAIYNEIIQHESGDSSSVDDADEPETRGKQGSVKQSCVKQNQRSQHLYQRALLLENELSNLRMGKHLASVHSAGQPPSGQSPSGQSPSGQSPSEQRVARNASPRGFAQFSVEQYQQNLAEHTLLLSYHILGDEILAVLITEHDIKLVRQISTTTQIEAQLDKIVHQWGYFRGQATLVERHLPLLEKNAKQVLGELYGQLIQPLESYLAAVQKPGVLPQLVIVPHGCLHRVPFQALFSGDSYLCQEFVLSYAPSATTYELCRQRSQQHPVDLATAQVLALAVSDPAIPAVEAETSAIAHAYQDATILLNGAATTDAMLAQLADGQVLHFATHGLYHGENPMLSALKFHDSWLTASEIARLDFNNKLVIMSTCESGRGAVLAGDEMIGLTRASLSAGASSLIASQWIVQDDTSAMLMAEWYARLARGHSPAAALRAAQLSIMSSHPHPYYWAPFIFIGSNSA